MIRITGMKANPFQLNHNNQNAKDIVKTRLDQVYANNDIENLNRCLSVLGLIRSMEYAYLQGKNQAENDALNKLKEMTENRGGFIIEGTNTKLEA